MKIGDLASFVLPGRWWALDTSGSDTQLLTTIKKHVEHAVGTADDRATLRRELRAQLIEAAKAARAANADRIYLASQLADGVPFPATLLVVRSGERQAVAGTVVKRAAALTAVLPASGSTEIIEEVDFPLARAVEVTAPSDERTGNVQVRYWLAAPSSGELIMLAFSCPLIELRDLVVELFDAIMTTVAFPEPAGV